MLNRICFCCTIIFVLMTVGGVCFGDQLSPKDTVINYYSAIKDGRYDEAAKCVSKKMLGDKTVKEFADEWKKNVIMAKLVILEFSVTPGKIEKESKKELALCQFGGRITISCRSFRRKANYEPGDYRDCRDSGGGCGLRRADYYC